MRSPINVKLSFLVGPINHFQPMGRTGRVARRLTKEESEYADLQIWWPGAFAHHNYPYLDQEEIIKDIPKVDVQAYLGTRRNKQLLNDWRDIGIDRLPYFSGHVLSPLDPLVQQNLEGWEVIPRYKTNAKSDKPYTAELAKSWLSHRAEDYSNYLLSRFAEAIEELGIEGLYFDQAGVVDSMNPSNGSWIDSNGVNRGSLDILATRNFYKRLASLFHLKGKQGYIFVHNSMSPILPAYSFVTGMVQGEEYEHALKNLDYYTSSELAEVQAKFSEQQYGVRILWLSQLWRFKVEGGKPIDMPVDDWLETDQYQEGFEKFISLVLLHGSSMYTMAPVSEKKNIYDVFQHYPVADAGFIGYWDLDFLEMPENVLLSAYKLKEREQYLMVMANFTNQEQYIDFNSIVDASAENESSAKDKINAVALRKGCQISEMQIIVDKLAYCFVVADLKYDD